MSYLRFTAFLMVIFCLSGCKRQIVSNLNINTYDQVIVTADNQYSLTMPQIFEKLKRSTLVSAGGTLTSEDVKNFIDSIVKPFIKIIKELDIW